MPNDTHGHRVEVVPMTLGLAPGQEPSEWYASCSQHNWHGAERDSRDEAEVDARRHRRSHPLGWSKVAALQTEGGGVAVVHFRAVGHVVQCEHPHSDCYCSTDWYDDQPRVDCPGCES